MKLSNIFQDGMVVEREAVIWGWAKPDEHVHATFAERPYTATADSNGAFRFTVTGDMGGPYPLIVGDVSVSVYVGYVFLCAGQSNMETPLSRVGLFHPNEITPDTSIRAFLAEHVCDFNATPDDTTGRWVTAEGDFGAMYAVPYFFAKSLRQHIDVPVGLICIPVGGSTVQAWLPEEDIPERLMVELNMSKSENFAARTADDGLKRTDEWNRQLEALDVDVEVEAGDWRSGDILASDHTFGSVWYRKTIRLTKEEADSRAFLNLGRAEDAVAVHINGEHVVSVGYEYPPCACHLRKGLLREGANVIAARVIGRTHAPRFVPGKRYVLNVGHDVDLSTDWRIRVGAVMPQLAPSDWLPSFPSGLYNGMFMPISRYTVRGILWYQGESNTDYPFDYFQLMEKLIYRFREKLGDVPFYYVRLPFYGDDPNGYWDVLREQQALCLRIPNTYMADAYDTGEANDLHPLDKMTVGYRLALLI